MAFYLIGASFYSVGSALFGQPIAAGAPLDERVCARELATLTRQLYASASATLAAGVRADGLAWTHAWDRRHAELTARCGALSPQHAALGALRMDVGEMLRSHQRQSAGQRRSLERALEAVVPSS